AIMHGEVAAVAFAEHGTFGVGRTQFPALGDGLAVGADQPLRDIKTAAVAFGQPEHGGQFGALDGVADLLCLRAVERERIVKIALHKPAADRPGGSTKPDLPRISGNEGLGKGDQLRALRGSFLDQRDGLVHGSIEIEKDRRRLNHRHLVFLMNQTHRINPFALEADTRWVQSLQPWQRAPLVRGGTKTCLNRQVDGRATPGACGVTGGRWKALLARLLAPFARRDAEPLLEDAAEMGEVVKAPREGDFADVPG